MRIEFRYYWENSRFLFIRIPQPAEGRMFVVWHPVVLNGRYPYYIYKIVDELQNNSPLVLRTYKYNMQLLTKQLSSD